METVIVIPARLESTRLPNKLLLDKTGKTLIEHTLDAAQTSKRAAAIVVATDSDEIRKVVERAGGTAVMTSCDHQSGTDRIAEAVSKIDAKFIVNVQGDEPEIDGKSIDKVFETLQNDSDAAVATLATPLKSINQLNDPACVKVIVDADGRALYFSRSPIPASRRDLTAADLSKSSSSPFLQHIGVYGYRRDCLLQFPRLKPPPIEEIESLEQLRFLFHGWTIRVEIVDHFADGIDTAEDYEQFVNRSTNG